MNTWCVGVYGLHAYATNGVCRHCGHYDETADETGLVIL